MDLLFLHPDLQILMAGQAEIRAFGQQEMIQFRFMGIVALGAFPMGHGSVLTPAFGHLLLQVGMAGEAEGILSIHCHSFVIRSMGIVAGEAHPIRKGLMVRSPDCLFHEISVTLSTHFGIRDFEKTLFIRPVRLVAGVAEGIHHGFVGIGLQELPLCIGMARIANPIHPILQDMFHIRPMRIMARITLPLNKWGMRLFNPPSLLLRLRMTGKTCSLVFGI